MLLKIMTTKIKAYSTLIEVVLLGVFAKIDLFEFTEKLQKSQFTHLIKKNSNANSLVFKLVNYSTT